MSLISEKYKSYLNQINCLIYKKKKKFEDKYTSNKYHH